MGSVGGLDVAIVVASFCAVFGLSIYVTLRSSRGGDVAAEFFLAGRNSTWWLIAASLVASNIGTEHFVGQAGAAAYSGVVLSLYEWISGYVVMSLGWLFAPVYLRVSLTTIPQFLEERFNKYCRALYVCVLLALYVLSKIGTSVYAGVVLLEVILGWSMWQSVPLIIISTALYTMGGGLKAVMFTDTLQFMIFLCGGIAGTIVSFNLVGGVEGLFDKLDSAGLTDAPHLFRTVTDKDYPWLAMVPSIAISGISYWCIDQEMAQRVLAGKNLSEVRLGTSTAGLLKLIPPFITVFPGMVARAMFEMCKQDPENDDYSEWCSAELDDSKHSDRAYPLLIVNSFPSGIKGLMIASFLAAMMSSISSVFNSASTVFTYDIYERLLSPPGGSSPQRLKLVGRILVAVITGLTICYLPVIDRLDRGLYVLGCSALSHFAPPVTGLFIAGLFIKRANGEGAIAGFISGAALGLVRFILSTLSQHDCDKDCVGQKQTLTLSNWFLCLNFNFFAVLLFCLTFLIILIVSLFYPKPDPALIESHTFRFTDLFQNLGRIPIISETEPLLGQNGTSAKETDLSFDERAKYVLAAVVSCLGAIALAICFVRFH